jgi:hypothetical protein
MMIFVFELSLALLSNRVLFAPPLMEDRHGNDQIVVPGDPNDGIDVLEIARAPKERRDDHDSNRDDKICLISSSHSSNNMAFTNSSGL